MARRNHDEHDNLVINLFLLSLCDRCETRCVAVVTKHFEVINLRLQNHYSYSFFYVSIEVDHQS